MGYHYSAHDIPSMLSETSQGVSEYWECSTCGKHFLNLSGVEGTWLDSTDTKLYSSFDKNDDRLLELPSERLDSENYRLVLDTNSKGSIRRNDLSLKTIREVKSCFDEKYGSCMTFKFDSINEFEFETSSFDFDNDLGEIFTYFYNPGNQSKLSIATSTETLIDNINFVSGWNRISFIDVNKIKGNKLIFKVGKLYSTPSNSIKISSFYGAKIETFNFGTQLVDLNISEAGYIDQNKEFKLDIIDNPKVSKITSVSFNGGEISTNEFVKAKIFGLRTGEQILHVKFVSNGINYETDYKIILCSKLISTKSDLDLFAKIANALGDSNKLQYSGYFMLANDIEYNGEWKSFISRNTFSNNWNLQFSEDSGFVGTFDGNGHVINGLCPSSTLTNDYNGVSFIYKLGKKGVIKNVGFTNASLLGAGGYVSSIGEGTIENVFVKYKNDSNRCDGLGTFFYYDRSNDLDTLDKSYAKSGALRVNNCFVDAREINLTNTNLHVIGSKKYGKVLLKNVYSVSPTSLVNNAVITDHSEAGSVAFSSLDEMKKNERVISDINENFNCDLFKRSEIIIPNVTSGVETISGFIKNAKTNYFVEFYEDDIDANTAVSFLVEKIKEATGAEMYVSKNLGVNCETQKVVSFIKDSTLGSLEYKIDIVGEKVSLIYNSPKQTKSLVFAFLSEIFKYKNFNFDLEKFDLTNKNQVNLTDFTKTYNGLANDVCNYSYYDDEKMYESGYSKLGTVLANVRANDESGKSGEYHNQFMFLPPDVYFESHPNWYTPNMYSYGGYYNKKTGVDWCYSNLCFNANGNNSELALMKNEFYKRLKEELLRQPNLNNICVGLGDDDTTHNNQYCSCDACRSDGNANISVIKFLNEMSLRLKADPDFADRDIYIYNMAYRSLETAPSVGSVTMDDHVGVWIAPISADYAYPLNDEVNNNYTSNNIKNWLKLTSNVAFYLYDTNYTRPFAPFYYFETMVKNHKYLSQIGVKFIYYCDITDNQASTAFGAFKNYILRQTLINADLTYDDLYNEFFSTSGYYGEAGPRLKYYYDELIKAMKSIGISQFGDVYNSHVFNSSHLGHYLGSMNFWKQYSIDEAYAELDQQNPNYETYKKHILAESIFLRITKYLNSGSWFDGDSESKFLADCDSLGIVKIQEGIALNHDSIQNHKSHL